MQKEISIVLELYPMEISTFYFKWKINCYMGWNSM